MILGSMLVLASTATGAWLWGRDDGAQTYWRTVEAVHAGERVEAADLVSTLAVVDAEVTSTLWPTSARIDGELVWTTDLEPGALVGRGDLTEEAPASHEVPLPVADGAAPHDLAVGDRVDVWVADGDSQNQGARADRLLAAVRVRSVAANSAGNGSTVVVEAGPDGPSGVAIARLASGRVTVVRVS